MCHVQLLLLLSLIGCFGCNDSTSNQPHADLPNYVYCFEPFLMSTLAAYGFSINRIPDVNGRLTAGCAALLLGLAADVQVVCHSTPDISLNAGAGEDCFAPAAVSADVALGVLVQLWGTFGELAGMHRRAAEQDARRLKRLLPPHKAATDREALEAAQALLSLLQAMGPAQPRPGAEAEEGVASGI